MFIQLTEALATMRQTDERGRPVPFTVEVTTCNEVTGTGGLNLTLENWILASVKPAGSANNERKVRKTTAPTPRNEYGEHMRRVKNPANDEIRQIHIRLITAFNGLIVLW